MLPQIIIFGEESYRDDTEMDTDTFLERLRTSPILPKTAAPPSGPEKVEVRLDIPARQR